MLLEQENDIRYPKNKEAMAESIKKENEYFNTMH
jgi:hypothetical protein